MAEPIKVMLDGAAPENDSGLSTEDAGKLMDGTCPRCPQGGDVYSGFGLNGGGYGPYWGCDTCGLFHKVQTDE